MSVVRHKRLELSLLSEPDPKSGASTNSANAASHLRFDDLRCTILSFRKNGGKGTAFF